MGSKIALGNNQIHENFIHEDEVKVGSDRSFCLVFSCFFAIIVGFKLYFGSGINNWIYFFGGGSIVFLVVAFTVPQFARPLNKLWFRFGLLLHKLISPIIMSLIFFLTVTPVGLVMRMVGKRPLNLKFDQNVDSYWTHRDPPSLEAGSFKNQF